MELWISQEQQKINKFNKKLFPGILLEAVLLTLVFGVGTEEMIHILTKGHAPVMFVALTGGSILLWLLLERWQRFGVPVGVACFVCAAALFMVLHTHVQNGMTGLWNQTVEVLGSKAGIYLTQYTVSEENMANDQFIFWMLLALVTGLVAFAVLRLRLRFITILWSMGFPVLIFMLNIQSGRVKLAVFYLASFLLVNWMHSERNTGQNFVENTAVFLAGAILVCLTVAVSGGVFRMIVPQEQYQSSELVANARTEFLDQTDRFRFKTGKVNSLPNGRLKSAGAWTASDDTALTVQMDQPDSLYLRGFVGSVYDGDEWKSISTADAWKVRDLFYWLHQDGFYGQMQIAGIRNVVEDDSLSKESGSIRIQNQNADSRYLYTPYEMSELPEGYTGETSLTDSTLRSGGLFGKRDYTLKSMGNLVKDFTTLGAEGYQVLSKGDARNLREDESYYNAFVYEEDTALPAVLEALFTQELGNAGNREQGHTDYYTAISRIRAYLEKNMTYSTATDVYNGAGDFTKNFLTKSKIGHSVHYATAAALMFRYYGIPSRYVEGYLVTPDDIKDKNKGAGIQISGKNGHAWTEIYIDGLGWVPVEMTPEYYGVMEEPDLTVGLEAEGSKAASLPETETKTDNSQEIQTHWNLKLAIMGLARFLLLLLFVFDIFCMMFFLAISGQRIIAEAKRKKAFAAADNRAAVRAMTGYAAKLYAHGTYTDELTEAYENTWQIGEKAAFSPHNISNEERKTAEQCVKKIKTELKIKTRWYDLWIIKYIERLL